MMLRTSQLSASTKKSRAKKTVSHPVTTNTGERPIAEIEVKAHQQPHMSLGNFTSAHPPKGFSIHINPDPEPEAIVTQITTLGSGNEYELVLHIANYGNKNVSAEVWPIR